VTAGTYPNWTAPAEDGQFLIWPEPSRLLADAQANHDLLASSSALIQNAPLADLRRQQRQFIGHVDDQSLLLASAHQCELHHPGVWAKDVLTHLAAAKADAQAFHFAVDTDWPKHLSLRWPDSADPRRSQEWPITDDPNLAAAAWIELVHSPTPDHLSRIRSALQASRLTFEPMAGQFLDSLRRLCLESDTLPKALTNAIHELNWSLGLRHHALVCSPLWTSEPYLALVHHILSRTLQFAADYNRALAQFRRENGIRTKSRPMPDLAVSGDSCEAPFWLDHLDSGTRQRASVFIHHDRFVLRDGTGQEFIFDPSAEALGAAQALARFLRAHNLRLAPRALTLTLFLRLLLADNFVHGIGGGRYDQVTDRLIASHWGIGPPAFAVTTATVYFPGAAGRTRVCLPCLEHERHQLRHRLLGERKMEFVNAIAAAPRRSLERRHLFAQLHTGLSNTAANHPAIAKWEQEMAAARDRLAEEQVLFDRELFFALQPRVRLEEMIERYRTSMRC
jgi:hypothetical protein